MKIVLSAAKRDKKKEMHVKFKKKLTKMEKAGSSQHLQSNRESTSSPPVFCIMLINRNIIYGTTRSQENDDEEGEEG